MQYTDVDKEVRERRNDTPLVSVIVPDYNVLPYMYAALDNVANQTYRNLKIITFDDGYNDALDR